MAPKDQQTTTSSSSSSLDEKTMTTYSYQKSHSGSHHGESRPLMIRHYCESESFEDKMKRQWKCNIGKLLTGLVMGMFVLTGVMIFVLLLPHPTNVGYNIKEVQKQVHVSEKGVYSVVCNDDNIDNNRTTFAELAQRMLPPWYEASLMAIDDVLQKDTLTPDSVQECRKALFTTRDMLDIFSPVFAKHSLWAKLRKQYKHGYELVGELQDLDHSGVSYSKSLLQQRVDAVLAWKEGFEDFGQRHNVRRFLGTGVDPQECTRHSASHLFWGEIDNLPCGSDLARSSLQHLAFVQLGHAMDYWNTVQDYDSVLEETREEEFHNLRKELRIVVDEVDLFQDIGIFDHNNDSDKSYTTSLIGTLDKAQTKLGHINDQWTAYHIYVTQNTHKKEQQKLAQTIDDMWDDFLEWATTHDLEEAIQGLLETTMT